MSPALTMCVNIGMVIVIYLGGKQAIAGNLQVGQIVAFTNYLLTTMTPLIMMTMLSNTWADGIAAAKRIDGVLETVPDIQDDPHAQRCRTTPGQIAFENVSFPGGNTAEVVPTASISPRADRPYDLGRDWRGNRR
jgi:ATP-binding cassette subfamily B protein